MRKQLLSMLLVAGVSATASAQTVNDQVEIGAGYANQVWYSMANDEQGAEAKDNWDLAFDMVEITSTIRINSESGVMLWNYPKGNYSAWNSVDTAGLSGWSPRYNSDTSWTYGAMGRYADPNNGFDLDWGTYDMTSHQVLGDSIYIIKLTNGDFKKLFIEKRASGKYTFKFANIDGSDEKTGSIDKANYSTENFGYYSLVNNKDLDREPARNSWDLVFTQYTGFVPIAYTVTGVLHNRGVRVARAENIANVATYKSWQAHTMMSEINTIGYNWKSFSGGGYSIKDSLVFFVKDIDDAIWKLVFTGFESSTGKYEFSKEKVEATSVSNINGDRMATLAVYPNPSFGSNTTLVYDFDKNMSNAVVEVYDMAGRNVLRSSLETSVGLHQYVIPAGLLQSGIYSVAVTADGQKLTQKLIVK